jgi:CxxC motif-containing protein (DUF1111 family)
MKLRSLLRPALLVALTASALAAVLVAPAGDVVPHAAYLQPVAGLDDEQTLRFRAGEKIFNTPWLAIPNKIMPNWDYNLSAPGNSEWGLGPTFLAQNCMQCHVQGGRGMASDTAKGPLFQQLLRLSVPGATPHGGPKPEPTYGQQLQSFDTIPRTDKNARTGEGELHVDWVKEKVTLPDGSVVELRRPKLRIEHLNFGPLAEGTMTSLRNTQAIFGLGYLEAVSEKDILSLAAAQKAQGLNGRPNYVRDDVHDRIALGRFGWKANQPSIRQQIATAFINDMGVTSPVYDQQNCPAAQTECAQQNHTGKPELKPEMWDKITFWAMMLDAPAPRDQDKPAVVRGRQLFSQAQCAACHVAELRTGKIDGFPQLSNRRIQPYTDLLLHDMGPGLADGRPDYRAGGADWRTAPLWGIGRSKQVNGSTYFLHDGRARDLTEAILWHGGEAQASRDAFAGLPKPEREALLAFLNSL